MYEDIIFALYSTDQTDWDLEINHASDNATKPDDEKYLALSDAVITKFFGTESDKDWRLTWEETMNNPLPKPSFITEGFFYIPTFPVFLSKIIFEYDFEI